MKEQDLLEKARCWFAITYGKTAEQAGSNCVKIWYKPIMRYSLRVDKYAEVVFGPGEKEVNALIKAQTFIRQGINWTIRLLLLDMLGIIGTIACMMTNNLEVLKIFFFPLGGINIVAGVIFLCLAHYLKPIENIYSGKVVTYMEK